MKALCIWQPYALAIARGWKPIENRTWLPPAGSLKPGDYLAIHASKRAVDEDDEWAVVDMAVDAGLNEAAVQHAIATLTPAHFGAVVAIARYDGPADEKSLTDAERAWWAGPKAWRFSDVVELPQPMPLRGMQGLFAVPPAMMEQLRAVWREQRAGQRETTP